MVYQFAVSCIFGDSAVEIFPEVGLRVSPLSLMNGCRRLLMIVGCFGNFLTKVQ